MQVEPSALAEKWVNPLSPLKKMEVGRTWGRVSELVWRRSDGPLECEGALVSKVGWDSDFAMDVVGGEDGSGG